ncbi:MAG: hypothetical protein GX433_00015 [Deltaproteobacteria bacterium]|nr:hypothetical protein [Deltaproteobacteria bacterium]
MKSLRIFLIITAIFAIFSLPMYCFATEGEIVFEVVSGCKSREYTDKLSGYVAAKDSEAFKKALMAGYLTGECVPFKQGERVIITDTALFSGLMKIRRKGDINEYWVNYEAVKTK